MMVWYKNINTTDVPTGRRRSSTSMGLAMTRSLGDLFAHNIGVSHKPHIVQRLIEPNGEFSFFCMEKSFLILYHLMK